MNDERKKSKNSSRNLISNPSELICQFLVILITSIIIKKVILHPALDFLGIKAWFDLIEENVYQIADLVLARKENTTYNNTSESLIIREIKHKHSLNSSHSVIVYILTDNYLSKGGYLSFIPTDRCAINDLIKKIVDNNTKVVFIDIQIHNASIQTARNLKGPSNLIKDLNKYYKDCQAQLIKTLEMLKAEGKKIIIPYTQNSTSDLCQKFICADTTINLTFGIPTYYYAEVNYSDSNVSMFTPGGAIFFEYYLKTNETFSQLYKEHFTYKNSFQARIFYHLFETRIETRHFNDKQPRKYDVVFIGRDNSIVSTVPISEYKYSTEFHALGYLSLVQRFENAIRNSLFQRLINTLKKLSTSIQWESHINTIIIVSLGVIHCQLLSICLIKVYYSPNRVVSFLSELLNKLISKIKHSHFREKLYVHLKKEIISTFLILFFSLLNLLFYTTIFIGVYLISLKFHTKIELTDVFIILLNATMLSLVKFYYKTKEPPEKNSHQNEIRELFLFLFYELRIKKRS